MKQIAAMISAGLVALVAGLPQISIDDDLKSVIGLIAGITLAAIGVYLGPAVARALRS